jgi:3'-5' exoribonuclease
MTHAKRFDLLKETLQLIADDELRFACEEPLNDTRFLRWPSAISMHHAYEGGLLAHTLEVAEIALKIAEGFPQVNRDILIAAALGHDYGKIFEYVVTDTPLDGQRKLFFTHSDLGTDYWVRDSNAMSHILSSAIQFHQAAVTYSVDRATRDAVIHCIHAHHGPVKEWGSPEAPRTIEALILHQADMLSSHYGATKEKP